MSEIEKILRKAQDEYVNTGSAMFDDEVFDEVLDWYNRETGKNISFIGASQKGKDPDDLVQLPYPMPSLNKITYKKNHKKQIETFLNNNPGPYVITSKVDGTSVQLIYSNSKLTIVTGGSGTEGFNISYIQKYIDFPEIEEDIVIRGELTISNKNFEKLIPYLEEEGKNTGNPRYLLNGLVNSKEINKKVLKKCMFTAFGILSSKKNYHSQLKKLERLGFFTPFPTLIEEEDPKKFGKILLEEFEERRNKKFRTDGIVIVSNANFSQVLENCNPSFAFAFKKNTIKITTVLSVQWNCTRYGYLTPIVTVKPVKIIGQRLENPSGVHAKEIVSKGIGPGAIVAVTFSGDSIPKIVDVILPAEPQMPDVDYHWNDTKVEIMIDNPQDDESIRVRRLEFFVKTIGMKNFGFERLASMNEKGISTIEKILRVTSEDLMEIEGFGQKMSEKFIEERTKALEKITWEKVMVATGIFGESIGIERCLSFLSSFPDWRVQDLTKKDLIEIDGFGDVISEKFEASLPKFKKWIVKNKMCKPKDKVVIKRKQTFKGEVVVFTGITAPELIKAEIESRGGIVKSTLVNSTTILVKKTKNFSSTKTEKAEEKGIKVTTLDKFMKKIFKEN